MEGTISYDLVNEHGGEGIFLRLAGGEEYPVANVIFHKFLPKDENSDSIFPSIDPEQDNFEALFFLEGKDESALEGAVLVIEDGGAEQTVALDAISREKPEG